MNQSDSLKKFSCKDFENVKPRPAEKIPAKSLDKNMLNKMELKGMTFKSVIVIVIVAILKAVLGIWFDEQTTTSIIEVIQQVLNAILGISVGTAIYGVRRRITNL